MLQHSADLAADSGVSMLVCFDHEEIGSASAQGQFSQGFNEPRFSSAKGLTSPGSVQSRV